MSLLANLKRLMFILAMTGKHGFALLVSDRLAARTGRPDVVSRPARLRLYFEALGGSFLKFGQMLALQPDILPMQYCDALFDLMDRIEPAPYGAIEAILTEDLGRPPAEIFDEIDPKPLATASIGQVHRAVLEGSRVVIKVRRPEAEAYTLGDIRIMRAVLFMIKAFHLKMFEWMVAPLDEFVHWTIEELDFRKEARYQRRLALNAADNPVEKIPDVYWHLTTQRVLVVEFLEGVTLLDYLRMRAAGDEKGLAALQAEGLDISVFAQNIVNNFLSDAFHHGLFHADLHPGNMMIMPNNVVGYVDFGITGGVSAYSRNMLTGLTLAMTRADMDELYHIYTSAASRGRKARPHILREQLEIRARTWYLRKSGGIELRVNITQIMLDMLMVSKQADLWPEQDVIKYIRSCVAIDGLITRLDPDFNLAVFLEETCSKYLKWQGRMDLLSADNLSQGLLHGGRLAGESGRQMDRMFTFLERLAMQGKAGKPERFLVNRNHCLAVMVVVLLILLSTAPAQPVWGFNLFTAQVVLLGATLITFLVGAKPEGGGA